MNFNCPHCGKALLNDGQTAGQVVACPFCSGQIQMPGPSAPPPPPLVATLPVAPYRRKPPAKQKTDPAPYIVAAVTLTLCIGVGGIGIWAYTTQKSNPTKNIVVKQTPRPKTKPAFAKQADVARTKQAAEETREPAPVAAPSTADIDQAVARKLGEQTAERKKRLDDLDRKGRAEIPPLKEAVSNAFQEIRDYQQKYDRVRAQLTGPLVDKMGRPLANAGISPGTKAQPSALDSREMKAIEAKGRERFTNMLSQLDQEYEQKMKVLGNKREQAESALEAKQRELDRQRQQVLIGS